MREQLAVVRAHHRAIRLGTHLALAYRARMVGLELIVED